MATFQHIFYRVISELWAFCFPTWNSFPTVAFCLKLQNFKYSLSTLSTGDGSAVDADGRATVAWLRPLQEEARIEQCKVFPLGSYFRDWDGAFCPVLLQNPFFSMLVSTTRSHATWGRPRALKSQQGQPITQIVFILTHSHS